MGIGKLISGAVKTVTHLPGDLLKTATNTLGHVVKGDIGGVFNDVKSLLPAAATMFGGPVGGAIASILTSNGGLSGLLSNLKNNPLGTMASLGSSVLGSPLLGLGNASQLKTLLSALQQGGDLAHLNPEQILGALLSGSQSSLTDGLLNGITPDAVKQLGLDPQNVLKALLNSQTLMSPTDSANSAFS